VTIVWRQAALAVTDRAAQLHDLLSVTAPALLQCKETIQAIKYIEGVYIQGPALLCPRLRLLLLPVSLLLLALLLHDALHAVWGGRGAGQVVAVIQQAVSHVLVLLIVLAVSVLCSKPASQQTNTCVAHMWHGELSLMPQQVCPSPL
jgi:hypothetical protein